jgi:hypothetical protein
MYMYCSPEKGGARLAGDSGAAQAYPAPTVRNLSITNLVATGTVGPHHIEPIQPFDRSLAPTRPRNVSGLAQKIASWPIHFCGNTAIKG